MSDWQCLTPLRACIMNLMKSLIYAGSLVALLLAASASAFADESISSKIKTTNGKKLATPLTGDVSQTRLDLKTGQTTINSPLSGEAEEASARTSTLKDDTRF